MAEYIVRGTGTDGNPVYLNKKVMLDSGNPDKHGTAEAAQNVLKTFLGYNRTHAEVPVSVRKSMRVVPATVYERDKAAEAIAAAKANGDGTPDGYFIRGRLTSGGCRFLDCVGNIDLHPFVWKTRNAAVRVLKAFQGSGKLTEGLSEKETASFAVIPYQKADPDAFLREADALDPVRPMWCVAGQDADGTFVYLTEDQTMSFSDRERAMFSSRQEAQDFLDAFIPKMKSPNRPWDTLPLVCQTLAVQTLTDGSGSLPLPDTGIPAGAEEKTERMRDMDMAKPAVLGEEGTEASDGQETRNRPEEEQKEKKPSLFPPLDEAAFSALDARETDRDVWFDGTNENVPDAETEEEQESSGSRPDGSAEPGQALSVLHSLLVLADTDFSACERELCGYLSRADRAKSDVLHKIELSDEVDEEEAIGLLRKILKDRRAYKDALLLFQEFEAAGGPQVLSRLAKLKNGFPDRSYRPRVLMGLFSETERDREED